jgi:hypothetical protein
MGTLWLGASAWNLLRKRGGTRMGAWPPTETEAGKSSRGAAPMEAKLFVDGDFRGKADEGTISVAWKAAP